MIAHNFSVTHILLRIRRNLEPKDVLKDRKQVHDLHQYLCKNERSEKERTPEYTCLIFVIATLASKQ